MRKKRENKQKKIEKMPHISLELNEIVFNTDAWHKRWKKFFIEDEAEKKKKKLMAT